jgi:hypothetical protein
MARFYLHLHNDVNVTDPEGRDFPDLNAARRWTRDQARLLVGQVAKDEGRIVLHHRIDIENEDGEVLDSIPFADAVKIVG